MALGTGLASLAVAGLAGPAIARQPNNRQLAAKEGSGVFVAPKGCPNLVSKEKFGDVEVRCEFLIPKGSNSGIKLNGQYEIHQIMLAKKGIFLLENMNTGPLAIEKVYEFLFVLGQPRITGAVQGIVNPVAIY